MTRSFCAAMLTCLFATTATFALTAPPDTLWTRTFGDALWGDYGQEVHPLPEGGFLIGGTTFSYGDGFPDMWLIKTDADGNELWQRPFGGKDREECGSVIGTGAGEYILAGTSFGLDDAWVIKTDSNSHIIWQRHFGGPYLDWVVRIVENPNGGFVFCGSAITAISKDILLVKIADNGDEIWRKVYGGPNRDSAQAVRPTSDGGFIVTGPTRSFGTGENDVWLIKTDAKGDSLWSRTYGTIGDEWPNSILQTDDGGYLITGVRVTSCPDERLSWLLKVDGAGNEAWQKVLDPGVSHRYEIDCIRPSHGRGYVATGSVRIGSDDDMLIVRLDEYGNELWTKTIGHYASTQFGKWIEPLADGGYIVVGGTSHELEGLQDLYLVRLGPEDMTGIADAAPATPTLLGNHPNPFNPVTSIVFSLSTRQRMTLTVHDTRGRLLRTLVDGVRDAGRHEAVWLGRDDAGNALPGGVYLYRLASEAETAAGKMVLVR